MPRVDPLVAEAAARLVQRDPGAIQTARRVQAKAVEALDRLALEFSVYGWPPEMQSILLRQVAREAMSRAMKADDAAKGRR